MGSAVAGLLAISGANANDLVGEWQETILVRNAKGYSAGGTLFGLMSRLKGENAENNEFNWFERDPVKRTLYADGVDNTVVTGHQVRVTNLQGDTSGASIWQLLAQGHILRNDTTGEYVRVNATPTSNAVSLTRAVNYASGAAVPGSYVIADNDVFTIITLAKDEGALPVRAAYEEPDVLTNYIQTFNSTVELTNAFKANKLRTDIEGPLKDRRIQALEKISKDIELAYLLGTKQRLAGSNGYEYLTGGIHDGLTRAGLTSNILAGGGGAGVSFANFQAWLETFMTVGSDAKLALAGPKAYSVISTYANSATNGFRIMNQETVFGMHISAINTPFGELDLAYHPLLREVPTYSDWMFVVDLGHVIQKNMEPLFLEPNIQTPGQDSYKEQFRAKLGLKLKFAEAFGVATDLQKIN